MATEFIDVLPRLREEKTSHAVVTMAEYAVSVEAAIGAGAVIDHGRVSRVCDEFTTVQAAVDRIACGKSTAIEFDHQGPEDFASIATRCMDDHP